MESPTQKNYPSRVLTSHEQLDVANKDRTLKCLTGMRPSGKLHLGHYMGALKNWKKLNDMSGIDCDFLIADYHVMAEPGGEKTTKGNVFEVVKDWLSVGLDPDTSNFVVQSYLRNQAELKEYLSFLSPVSSLMNNPTLKAELEKTGNKDGVSVGFFTYPVSQVADILGPLADIVPVGDDQIPHIEDTRKIARKFNKKYGNLFPLPKALIGEVPRLPGITGEGKMGKSDNNGIFLSDSADQVAKKVKSMYTDPNRIKITDPGNVEGNRVFSYLDIFYDDKEHLQDLKDRYTQGGKSAPGDSQVKKLLTDTLNSLLDPIRNKRAEYEGNEDYIREILKQGTDNAKEKLEEVIEQIREKMGVKSY